MVNTYHGLTNRIEIMHINIQTIFYQSMLACNHHLINVCDLLILHGQQQHQIIKQQTITTFFYCNQQQHQLSANSSNKFLK
jgi:hypothetical protein